MDTTDHAHGWPPETALGWEDGWGVNGVLPGSGRCVACHLLDIGEGYLLCKPCWARLPTAEKRTLTALWVQLRRGTAGDIGHVRAMQTAALDSIDHVPPDFCPYCPHKGQKGARVFRRIRPDACVAA